MIFTRRDLSDFYCCWGRLKTTQDKDKANYIFCLSTVLFLHTFCQLWISCWHLRNEKRVMKLRVQSSSHSFVILIWGVYNCQDNYPVCLLLLDSSILLVSVINSPVQLLTAGLQLFSFALSSLPFAPLLRYKYFQQENGTKPFLLQLLQEICMLLSVSCFLSSSPAISDYFFLAPLTCGSQYDSTWTIFFNHPFIYPFFPSYGPFISLT